MKKTTIALACVAGMTCASVAAAGVTPVSGFDAAAVNYGEAKMRNFGTGTGFELSLAKDVDGPGPDTFVPVDTSYDGRAWPYGATNTFSITYNSVAQTLDMTVNGIVVPQLTGFPAATINYLQFSIVDRRGGADADQLDMTSLDLDGDDILVNDTTGWQTWYIADNSLASGFTVTGAFTTTGRGGYSSQEGNKIVFNLGTSDLAPAAVPLPGAAWMGLALLGGVGVLSRRRKKQIA